MNYYNLLETDRFNVCLGLGLNIVRFIRKSRWSTIMHRDFSFRKNGGMYYLNLILLSIHFKDSQIISNGIAQKQIVRTHMPIQSLIFNRYYNYCVSQMSDLSHIDHDEMRHKFGIKFTCQFKDSRTISSDTAQKQIVRTHNITIPHLRQI